MVTVGSISLSAWAMPLFGTMPRSEISLLLGYGIYDSRKGGQSQPDKGVVWINGFGPKFDKSNFLVA